MCCEAQAKVEAKLRRGIFLGFICFGHWWQTIGRKLRTKATKHYTIVGLQCAENAHSMLYCTVFTEREPKRQQFHVAPGMQQPSSVVSTSLRSIFKNALQKSYSYSFRIAYDKSAVSLLENWEQRYIKATNNDNNTEECQNVTSARVIATCIRKYT